MLGIAAVAATFAVVPVAGAAVAKTSYYAYSGDPLSAPGAVRLTDNAGQANVFTAKLRATGTVVVTDANQPIKAELAPNSFGSCVATIDNSVECLRFCPDQELECGPDGIRVIVADLGRGNDSIYVGAGNSLQGVLTGGPGNDTITGGSDYDRIIANDGERDVVYCGAGSDDVIIDSLDFLPDGSCEGVYYSKPDWWF